VFKDVNGEREGHSETREEGQYTHAIARKVIGQHQCKASVDEIKPLYSRLSDTRSVV
jgi:hypothetical protein